MEAVRGDGGAVVHRSAFLKLTVPPDVTTWSSMQAVEKSGVDVVAGGSEQVVLWRTSRFLAPLATSYWGCDLGRALARDPHLTDGLIAEVATMASLEGLPTGAEELTEILLALPRGMRSSLRHDLAAGNPTELDALGGSMLRLAEARGVPAPTLKLVVGGLSRRTGAGNRPGQPS